tara:strand:- start:83 stop:1237 length:1155 start_codon:yes stop_codon:yes gene_type:complete
MPFNFFISTNITFEAGSCLQVRDIIKSEKWHNVGLLVDHNIIKLPIIKELLSQISDISNTLIIKEVEVAEPTYNYLEDIRAQFTDTNLDVIVGIGGGSALDVSKAMAVLVNNKEKALHYRGFDKMTEPVLPIIAIPTTAGTGSEITPNASFVDTIEMRKLGINGESIRPKYALLDPELTISCPEIPTISAGVDAIVHCHDAFISKGHNTVSRVFSSEGFRRVFNYLPLVLEDLTNISYRSEVMYGALFAAMGMIHSGGGATSVMSYPLGVRYKVPHGFAGGVFLPHVVEYNISKGITDYSMLYRLIDGSDLGLSESEQSQKFLDKMRIMWKKINVPSNISQYGFNENEIEEFIDDAMEMKGGLDGNPIPFYGNEIRNTLLKLIN